MNGPLGRPAQRLVVRAELSRALAPFVAGLRALEKGWREILSSFSHVILHHAVLIQTAFFQTGPISLPAQVPVTACKRGDEQF